MKIDKLKKIRDAAKYLIDDQVGIIKLVSEHKRAPGEPNLFSFYAKSCNTSAFCKQENFSDTGGASYSPDIAFAKAIGEAVERYCAAIYDKSELPFVSKNNAPFECINLDMFNIYSQSQYEDPTFPYIKVCNDTALHWVSALELGTNNEVYVPAQIVYIPYVSTKTPVYEPLFSQPISTGMACHETYEKAALSAIYEVIERDAFTLTWQSGLSRPQVDLSTISPLNYSILEKLRVGNTTINIFDITLDSGICTILTTLRSSDKKSPALAVATATDINPEEALRKSLEELAHTRRYSQVLMDFDPPVRKDNSYMEIKKQRQHLRFWCEHENLPMASFLFESNQIISFNAISNFDQNCPIKNLKFITKKIEETGYKIYIKEVTSPDIQSLGLFVIRALIPRYHPLQIGHKIRALGGTRLWTIPQQFGSTSIQKEYGDINLPHPFP